MAKKKTETIKPGRPQATRQQTKAKKQTQAVKVKKEKQDVKPKWKCVCGYEGDDFIHFRAVTWRTSSPSYSADVYFHDQGVNFLICPKCGTAKCNIREEGDFKYVKRANFNDPRANPWPVGWCRRNDSFC